MGNISLKDGDEIGISSSDTISIEKEYDRNTIENINVRMSFLTFLYKLNLYYEEQEGWIHI